MVLSWIFDIAGCQLLYPDVRSSAALIAHAVDRIDTMLEDWYPDIGIRFVQNTKGIYLVTRLVPCVRCLLSVQQALEGDNGAWSLVGVDERTWMPEVVRPVRVSSSKNVVAMVTTAVATEQHYRSSSVPVRTGSRDKSAAAELQLAGSRNRPSHRTRSEVLCSCGSRGRICAQVVWMGPYMISNKAVKPGFSYLCLFCVTFTGAWAVPLIM